MKELFFWFSMQFLGGDAVVFDGAEKHTKTLDEIKIIERSNTKHFRHEAMGISNGATIDNPTVGGGGDTWPK